MIEDFTPQERKEYFKLFNDKNWIKFDCPLFNKNGKKGCSPPLGWVDFDKTQPVKISSTGVSIQTGKQSNLIVIDLDLLKSGEENKFIDGLDGGSN